MSTNGGPWPRGLQELFGRQQKISYVDYSAAVLYGEGGYYRQTRSRVGTGHGTDFVTNLAVRSILQRLLLAAVEQMWGRAADFGWVEIAAEPEGGLWADTAAPFASSRVIRLGEPLQVNGRVVVFANEWLDAYPFCRMVFRSGQWLEVGVEAAGQAGLREFEAAPWSAEARQTMARLPANMPDGYRFDYAPAALEALRQLLSQDWQGGLLLCDYGRSWGSLVSSTPQGTARAYSQHRQMVDLLESPGQMDLTTDICWDDCLAVAGKAGFEQVQVRRQEVFFMQEAAREIQNLVEAGTSAEKSGLRQLLSPAHFGRVFQWLSAFR